MKALKIEIEDTGTGAVVGVHALATYTVDKTAKLTQAHFAGYVSAKALAEGKRPVALRHVSIPGAPEDDQLPADWIYSRLTVPADDATRAAPGYMPSAFVGAELVEV